VISVQNDLERLEELEKREELYAAMRDCYALAIDSSAHYAVEVDRTLTVEFRTNLWAIEKQARAARSPEQLRRIQSSFRGELREYRDKSAEELMKLRKEVNDATAAVLTFADSVAFNGVNHEQEMQAMLRRLESTARGNNIEEIRGAIDNAINGIESSVQYIHRSNQLVVAQLQDEIRSLHQQFELERKALYTDRPSGAWNRQKTDIHLDNLLRQNQSFCVLLVNVRNYRDLEAQYSRNIVEGTLKALITRFAALTGDNIIIGRWSEDQFVAILDVLPGNAGTLAAEAAAKLAGPYSVQENGLSQRVILQATAVGLDRQIGEDQSIFYAALEQLTGPQTY
jgi:GGDEF domain-containing protein